MPRPPSPDPFVLDSRIGAGATGEVWRGVHPSTGLPVAVKILRKAGADSAAELRHEARAVARLDHPHVIRLYDHGVLDDGRPWIAMEHASGGSLQGRSAVSFRQLATWLLAVLDGLGHAHARGVLHLDLSPGNVVLGGPADRRPGLKLADFGVATQPGQQGGHAGTAPFMAPEQFGNPDDVGPSADLYALGCLAQVLTTGTLPFPAEELPAMVFRKVTGQRAALRPLFLVPPTFESWLDRLLDPEPTRRFSCAADAAWALLALPGPLPQGAPPQPDDWRPIGYTAHPPRLVDAGLSLVGLRRPPLVGREDLQDRLWRTLGQLRIQGRARIVILDGPGGTGTSALARWLGERAEELGAARVLRLGPTGLGPEPVDDPGVRAAAFRARLEQLSADRPVIVVLDDVAKHPEAHDTLLRALDSGDLPVLALVTGLATGAPPSRGPSPLRIEVPPLPPAWHLPIVENLLGLRPTLAQRVVELAGGRPLVAEQLVRSWAEQGLLEPGPDGHGLRAGAEPTFSGLEALLGARLGAPGGVPRETLLLLGLAALLPEPVPRARWADAAVAAGLPPPGPAADFAAGRNLLVRGPTGWSFSHTALREAVRDAVRRAGAWASLHRATAAVLRAGGADDALVGEQLLEAGEALLATPLLRAATEQRIDRSDHRRAAATLALWRRALDEADVPEDAAERGLWWVHQTFIVRAESRFEAALAAAEQAATIAARWEDPSLACAARLERGRCLLNLGRHEEAAQDLLAARVEAEACGRAAVAAAASRMAAIARQFQGRLDEAAALARSSLEQYRALGQPIRAAWAGITVSQVEKQAGRLDQVEGLLRQAQALVPPGEGEAVRAEIDNGLGELLRLQGRLDEAQPHYEASLRWMRASGSTDRSVVEANLGFLLLQRHAWAEAHARLLPAREEFARQLRRDLTTTLDVALLAAAGGLGDWAEWDHRAGLAGDALNRTGFTYYEVAISAELAAEVAARRGDVARASWAHTLALQQYRAMGREDDVRRLTKG